MDDPRLGEIKEERTCSQCTGKQCLEFKNPHGRDRLGGKQPMEM